MDPRRFFARHKSNRQDRKSQQLCRQVFRTLSLVLGGDGSDRLLSELQIVSVTPAPDASRLLVRLHSSAPLGPQQIERVLGHLEFAKGRLRREVAAAVCRRRAPDLVFQVGSGPGGGA